MTKNFTAPFTAHLDTGATGHCFRTLTEARKWAEDYGTTANRCTIYDRGGRLAGMHSRDTAGDGTRWFRATV